MKMAQNPNILDFEHEKKRLSWRDQLRHAGWDLGAFETDEDDGSMAYIVDADTGYLQCVRLLTTSLEHAEQQWQKDRSNWHLVVDGLSLAIDRSNRKPDLENQTDTGILSTLYLAGTKTWKTMRTYPLQAFSVFIIRYTDMSCGKKSLRPAALRTATLMSPEQVYDTAEHILSIDAANHPERFSRRYTPNIPRKR